MVVLIIWMMPRHLNNIFCEFCIVSLRFHIKLQAFCNCSLLILKGCDLGGAAVNHDGAVW